MSLLQQSMPRLVCPLGATLPMGWLLENIIWCVLDEGAGSTGRLVRGLLHVASLCFCSLGSWDQVLKAVFEPKGAHPPKKT